MRSSRCAWAAAPPSHSPKYFPHGNQNGPSRLRRPSSASSRALVARPHLLRPAKLLAPLVRIRPIHSAHEGFYFQASCGSVSLPVAGYDYNSDWTPLLAGLSPAGMAASLAAPDRAVVDPVSWSSPRAAGSSDLDF